MGMRFALTEFNSENHREWPFLTPLFVAELKIIHNTCTRKPSLLFDSVRLSHISKLAFRLIIRSFFL